MPVVLRAALLVAAGLALAVRAVGAFDVRDVLATGVAVVFATVLAVVFVAVLAAVLVAVLATAFVTVFAVSGACVAPAPARRAPRAGVVFALLARVVLPPRPDFAARSATASSSVIDSTFWPAGSVALTLPCFTYGP